MSRFILLAWFLIVSSAQANDLEVHDLINTFRIELNELVSQQNEVELSLKKLNAKTLPSTIDKQVALAIKVHVTSLDKIKLKQKEFELKYNNILASASKSQSTSITSLTNKLTALTSRYNKLELKYEVRMKSNADSYTLTSVMLTCVAVIVTALGVGVALLAFWGYRNIREASIKASVDKAELVIDRTIQSGKFNEIIFKASQSVIYRGVMSDIDFPTEETDSNESV